MWRIVILSSVAALLAACGSSSSPQPPGTTAPVVPYFRSLPEGRAWVLTEQSLSVTSDGGRTWNDVTPTQLRGHSLGFDVVPFALDGSSAWVARFSIPSTEAPSVNLYRTTDGGTSWTARLVPLDISSGAYGGAGSVFFLDERHGWLMARLITSSNYSKGVLFRTADGGASWMKVSAPAGDPVAFVTPLDGWMAGGPAFGELYVTHDGGVTWDGQQVPRQPAGNPSVTTIATPRFFDAEHGVLPVQVRGSQTQPVDSLYFYVTNDGGASWTQSGSPLQVPAAGDLLGGGYSVAAIFDVRNWYVVADKSYATHDAGHTWSAMKMKQAFSAYIVDFATAQDGWAYSQAGVCRRFKEDCYQEPHLIRTQDGGRTWVEVAVP